MCFVGDGRAEPGAVRPLEWVAVALLAVLVLATVGRPVVGPGWLGTVWGVAAGLFGLTVLAYLGSGGQEIVVGRRGPGGRLPLIALVGRAGVGLFSLSLLGNCLAAMWDRLPPAVAVARDITGGCLLMSVALYVVLRYRNQRSRG